MQAIYACCTMENTFLADCVVWNRDNNLWNIQDTLTFTDTVRASRVSDFAVLSRDGNTAVVNFGATWVYVRSGNQWVQQGPKLIVTLPFDSLYSPNQTYASSAISGDGNTIVSLAQFNRRAAVVFYYRQGNIWTQDSTFLHDAGDYGGKCFYRMTATAFCVITELT